jgi:curved DNA-binding protein CbpA
MPEQVDYYRVLHVSRQATLLEIKRAFRRLARQFHPDLNPNDGAAAAQFRQISAAYAVLSDRQRREKYDEKLSPEPAAPEPSQAQAVRTEMAQFAYQYQRGLDQLALRDYPGAIAAFGRAIALHSESVEAYLGRCRANEELKNDRAILDDCYRLLQIDPQLAQAYYHQGRARFRLGYLQGAVDSYTHAIALRETFALAYCQRGRVLLELKESDHARQDLQKASQLFRVQNDLEQYRQVERLLNGFNPPRLRSRIALPVFQETFAKAIVNLPALVLQPGVSLRPVFAQLKPAQAIGIGVFYALATAGCFGLGTLLGTVLAGRMWSVTESLGLGLMVGPLYLVLAISGAILRRLARSRGSWPGDFFLAGVALLPMAGWALLRGLALWGWMHPILMAFAGCYSVVILYVGCKQLSEMAETAAMVAVPLMLIASASAVLAFLS